MLVVCGQVPGLRPRWAQCGHAGPEDPQCTQKLRFRLSCRLAASPAMRLKRPTMAFPFVPVELFFQKLCGSVQSEVKLWPAKFGVAGYFLQRVAIGRDPMLENESNAGTEGGLKPWLESVGLGQYTDLFARHRLDLDVMPDLTEADLAELGLPLGDRKRLQRAMAALFEADSTDEPASAVGPRPRMEVGAERRQHGDALPSPRACSRVAVRHRLAEGDAGRA